MKKVFGVCMAAVLTLSALPVCGVNAEEATYALGDVDMDGVVTGHDTAMVSRYVLDDTYTLTDEQLKLADVNEDGVVDQADVDKLHHEMQVYELGDVDLNGYFGMTDAVQVLQYSAKVASGWNLNWTTVQKNLADVDLSGKLDVNDGCCMLYGWARLSIQVIEGLEEDEYPIYKEDNPNQYYYSNVRIVVKGKDNSNGHDEPGVIYRPEM